MSSSNAPNTEKGHASTKSKHSWLAHMEKRALGDQLQSIWSTVIFISNIRILIFSIFWAAADETPVGIFLLLEIFFEYMLLLEILVRICLRNRIKIDALHINHPESLRLQIICLISSLPVFSFSLLAPGHLVQTGLFSYLNLIKLVRGYMEANTAMTNLVNTSFFRDLKHILYMKITQGFLLALYYTHASACVFIFLEKYHPTGKTWHTLTNLIDQPSWWVRQGTTYECLIGKYVDGISFAIGDIPPGSFWEGFIAIFLLILSVSVFAMNFADFNNVLGLIHRDEEARAYSLQKFINIDRKKYEQALEFCTIKRLPPIFIKKIKQYYKFQVPSYTEGKYFLLINYEVQYTKTLKQLPKSLEIEISVFRNKKLLEKTNLFNLGDPSFILNIAKFLTPQMALQGDTICQSGDIAEEIFFIKSGRVEVLANDNETRMAVLLEGAYFGEIGVLLTGSRTVTCKALTVCHLEVLKKSDLESMMDSYPKQIDFLKKVALQRIKLITPKDLEEWTFFEPNGSRKKGQYKTVANFDKKSSVEKLGFGIFDSIRNRHLKTFFRDKTANPLTVHTSRLYKEDEFDIDSPFYNIWGPVVLFAYFLTLLYVPYTLCHGLLLNAVGFTIECTICGIYLFDIYVNYHTNRFDGLEQMRKKDAKEVYLKREVFLDVISAIPFSIFLAPFNFHYIIPGVFKGFYLLKGPRVRFLYTHISQNVKGNSVKNTIFTSLVLLTLVLNTISCIMYAVARFEYQHGRTYHDNEMIRNFDFLSEGATPLLDRSEMEIYLGYLHWSFAMTGRTAYGDLEGYSILEVFCQSMTVLFLKMLTTFIIAKFTDAMQSENSARFEHTSKTRIWGEWLSHLEIPNKTVKKINNYNETIWEKLGGLDENAIMDDLPLSLQYEIRAHLLKDLVEQVGIFPHAEPGFLVYLIRSLRFIQIPKGEYVYKKGDLAAEMYFILDGTVNIYDDDGSILISLTKNSYFGEMAIISGTPSERNRDIRAETPLSLAKLPIDDFNAICARYPSIQNRIHDKYEQRKNANELKQRLKKPASDTEENIFLNSLSDVEDLKSPKQKTTPMLFRRTVSHSTQDSALINKDTETKTESSNCQIVPGARKVLKLQTAEVPYMQKVRQMFKSRFNKPVDSAKESTTEQDFTELSFKEDPTNDIKELYQLNISQISSPKGTSQISVQESDELNLILNSPKLKLPEIKEAKDENEELNKTFVFSEPNRSQLPKAKAMNPKLAIRIPKTVPIRQFWKNMRKKIETGLVKFWTKYLHILIFLTYAFNFTYLPLTLAFSNFRYEGVGLALELIGTLILAIQFGVECQEMWTVTYRYRIQERHGIKYEMTFERLWAYVYFTFKFLEVIPFALIFDQSQFEYRVNNFFFILLQSLRIFSFTHVFDLMDSNKFKMNFLAAIGLSMILLYAAMNHITTCYFILISHVLDDPSQIWVMNLTPNGIDTNVENQYLQTSFFTYMSTTGLTPGDVPNLRPIERFGSISMCFLSILSSGYIFGYISIVFEQSANMMKKNFQTNYQFVSSVIKKANFKHFVKKVDDYFSYLWTTDKGVDEAKQYDQLPPTLRFELIEARYQGVIKDCLLFKNDQDILEAGPLRGFFQHCKFETLLRDNTLVFKGQPFSGVYIVLDGEIEAQEPTVRVRYHISSYFGAMIPDERSKCDFVAHKTTKVAFLPDDIYSQLIVAFPNWYLRLSMAENIRMLEYGQRNHLVEKEKSAGDSNLDNSQIVQDEIKMKAHSGNPTSRKNSLFGKNAFENSMIIKPATKSLAIDEEEENFDYVKEASRKRLKSCILLQADDPVPKMEKNAGMKRIEPLVEIDRINWPTLPLRVKKKPTQTNIMKAGIMKSSDNQTIFSVKGKQTGTEHDLSFTYKRKKDSIQVLDGPVKQSTIGNQSVGGHTNRTARKPNTLESINQAGKESKSSMPTSKAILIEEGGKFSHMKRQSTYTLLGKWKLYSQLIKGEQGDLKSVFEKHHKTPLFVYPFSKAKEIFNLVHFALAFISAILQPLRVSFLLSMTTAFVAWEIICTLESVLFIIVMFRTAYNLLGIWSLDFIVMIRTIPKFDLLLEIVGAIPFNVILKDQPNLYIPFDLLRIHRILLLFRLATLLEPIENRNPDHGRFFWFFKVGIYFYAGWSFFSCFWMYYEFYLDLQNIENSFAESLWILDQPVWCQYCSALLFVLNIFAPGGYPNLVAITDVEKILYIISMWIGNAVFGFVFGLFEGSSLIIPERFRQHYDLIYQVNLLSESIKLPASIKHKLESYYEYAVNKTEDQFAAVDSLVGKIPRCMFDDINIVAMKSFISNFKFLGDVRANPLFLRALYPKLERQIYLPNDFVIYKDDIGEEMFFISEGELSVMDVSDRKVISSLKNGQYFGEIALFNHMRRTVSVISSSFSQVFLLKKEVLHFLTTLFPLLQDKLMADAKKKYNKYNKSENYSRHKKRQQSKEPEEEHIALNPRRKTRLLSREKSGIMSVMGAVTNTIPEEEVEDKAAEDLQKEFPHLSPTKKKLKEIGVKKTMFRKPGLMMAELRETANGLLNISEIEEEESSDDEYLEDIERVALIEENELEMVDQDEVDKVSLRLLPKSQSRRFSRTTAREERSANKQGLYLNWGINSKAMTQDI